MIGVLTSVASMSVAGSVLYAAVEVLRRFFRWKMRFRWQFLLLVLVLARFLIPFGPTGGLLGQLAGAGREAGTVTARSAAVQGRTIQDLPVISAGGGTSLPNLDWPVLIGGIWLTVAAVLFMVSVWRYRLYVRHVCRAAPADKQAQLETLGQCLDELRIHRRVRLLVSSFVPSPMLIGVLRPAVVLPRSLRGQNLRHVLLHELTHVRRQDIVFRWLALAAVCLHWLNPLVYVLRRQLEAAGELACDEAVLEHIGSAEAAAYGSTLLAAARSGMTRPAPGTPGMAAQNSVLRERLEAIVIRSSGRRHWRSLGVCAVVGTVVLAIALGVFSNPGAAAPPSGQMVGHPEPESHRLSSPEQAAPGVGMSGSGTSEYPKVEAKEKTVVGADAQECAEQAYASSNLPRFQLCFPSLTMVQQETWLRRLYGDRAVPFYGAAVNEAELSPAAAARLLEEFYADENAAFFSMTLDILRQEELRQWYERAEADGSWTFLSILADALGWEDKFNALEEELAKRQVEEYAAVGIEMDNDGYLYCGERLRVLYDPRPDQSCFLLNIDPAGLISIEVERDAEGVIRKVRRMRSTEAEALLADLA